MTALSFCPSRSNSWILELHIWNILPAGHGLVADRTVKGAWVVERQRRESNLSGYFFHLFIYMEMMYFLLFFSLFAPLGHLGVSMSLSILYHKFQQLDYMTTDIWKVCKFLAN